MAEEAKSAPTWALQTPSPVRTAAVQPLHAFLYYSSKLPPAQWLKTKQIYNLRFWRSEVWKALFLQAARVGNRFSKFPGFQGPPALLGLVAPSSSFRACVAVSHIPPTLLPSSTSWDPCDRAQMDKPGSSSVSGSADSQP